MLPYNTSLLSKVLALVLQSLSCLRVAAQRLALQSLTLCSLARLALCMWPGILHRLMPGCLRCLQTRLASSFMAQSAFTELNPW